MNLPLHDKVEYLHVLGASDISTLDPSLVR